MRYSIMASVLVLGLLALVQEASATNVPCLSNCNTNTNTANGGAGGSAASSATGGSASQQQTQQQNQNNHQTQVGVQSQDNEQDNYQRSYIIQYGDEREVHSAYAPALSAGSDTCLGSTTAGAQGGMFGLSFGTNWTDQNCENIRSAKALFDMGEKKAALLVMCLANGGRNVPALEASGYDCSPVLGEDKETAFVGKATSGTIQVATLTETKKTVTVIHTGADR